MGTCCGAHLQTKIRDCAKNAQNGAVTVTVIENPKIEIQLIGTPSPTFTVSENQVLVQNPTFSSEWIDINAANAKAVKTGNCDYCEAPAEFTISYYPKNS